jgi:hypothetical protein
MDEQAEITVIFGQRGSGKTSRARHLVRRERRVLYYDTVGHDFTEGVIFDSLTDMRGFWRQHYRGRFHLVYRPTDPVGEIAAVSDLALACEDMVLVVEEVDLLFASAKCCPEFRNVICRGRHYGLSLVAVTQAPMGFGPLLRSQAHNWCIFATREPDHIDYFKKRCPGVDPQDIASLPKWSYIAYTDGDDSYWICRDDPVTGGTDKLEREYVYDRAGADRPIADSGNLLPGETVELRPQDRTAGLPAARAAGDSPDGRTAEGDSRRAGPVPA